MKTIKGDKIFFNFIEIEYDSEQMNGLMNKIFDGELDGFVVRNVLPQSKIKELIQKIDSIDDKEFLKASNGKLFPYPHASITDKEEKLDLYVQQNKKFNELPFNDLKQTIQDFFHKIKGRFTPDIPKVLNERGEAVYGNFRMFMPNMGGLFVHCGYLFQEEAPLYYDVVEEMDKEGQLSYFMVLQYPEQGGELTIYDMLWPEIQKKDDFHNNEYVFNEDGEKVFLKNVESFSVRPEPGDILVFKGGPIWHRVEEIEGNRPRITFGGFINFSKDKKNFYYWS